MPNIYVTIYLPNINTKEPFLYLGSNWNDNEKYLGSPSNKFIKEEIKNNPNKFKKIILHKFTKEEITKKSLLKLEEKYLKIFNVRKSSLFFNMWDFCPTIDDNIKFVYSKLGGKTCVERKTGIHIDNILIRKEWCSVGGKNCTKIRKEKNIPQFINVNHSEVGKKSAETHKRNKTNFYNSEFQKKMSDKGSSKGGKIGGKMIHVNDGINKTRISSDKLDQFLLNNPNWKLGCLIINKRKTKHCWVSNNQKTLRIYETELETYILNGWKRGRKFI